MADISLSGLNWLAVIVAGVVAFLVGAAWYGPAFGKRWMALTKITEEIARKGAAAALGGAFILGILTALFLGIVLDAMAATTIADGILGGLIVWLGFFAIPHVSDVTFERRPSGLYALNQGYYLVTIVLMGIILAVWQ